MNPPRHILVIHLREIGDVLLATPVFSALRRRFPGARLTAVVQKKCMEMVTGNPHVDEILPVVKWHESREGGWAGALGEIRFLRQIRGLGADAVVDLTANDRSALLTWASGAAVRVGRLRHKGMVGRHRLYSRLVSVNPRQPMVGQLLEVLKGLELEEQATEYGLCLTVTAADRQWLAGVLPAGVKPVQVHPTSRVAQKCWSPQGMRQVIEGLLARGERVVVTSGPDPRELAYVAAMLSGLPAEGVVNLAGGVTLKQLAALSGACRLFIGVDSAPMHMAAAMGTPVVGLFGPSDETLWAPWGEHRIVSLAMGCRLPCKQKKGCSTIACMTGLTPELVLEQVDALLI